MAASPSSTLRKPSKLRSVDDGQQVVDFEGEIVGEAVDVVAAALVEQQFEQAGDAAGARVRQHLVAASGAGRGCAGRAADRALRRARRRAG